jgi:DNA repair exonuclease SbcCD ATPase subunit
MTLFRRIEPFFILNRRRFDIALKRAIESFKFLSSFSSKKYVKADKMEEAFSMINKLLLFLRAIETVQKRKRQTEIRKKDLEGKIERNRLDIEVVQKKTEMQGLVQTNNEIESLEKKVKKSLQHLQKPFFKFQVLSRGPGQYLMLDEAKKLDGYLNETFEAFATEEDGYPILKSILRKIVNAFDQGKLKLKSSRLRKAKLQIKSIVDKETLIPLHRKCTEVFHRRKQILTSEAMESSQTELAQHQKKLSDLIKRRKFVDSKYAVLEGEYQELLQKIESQKEELEKTVLRLTEKRVTVKYELPVS